jgi:hypothetical protein
MLRTLADIRNTRDVTFFNKDESMTSGSFSYFTIHGLITEHSPATTLSLPGCQ